MNISLNHDEIVQAITDYVGNNLRDVDGRHITVTMKAGRGGNGYSAQVSILDEAPEVEETSSVDPTPKRKRRTKAEMEAARASEVAAAEGPSPTSEAVTEEDSPFVSDDDEDIFG